MSNIPRAGPSGSKPPPPPQEPLFGRDPSSKDRKIVDCSEAHSMFSMFGDLTTNTEKNMLPYLRCYTDFSCPDNYEPKRITISNGQSVNGDKCVRKSGTPSNLPRDNTPICRDGKVLVSLTSRQKVCVKPIVTPSK
jgi:hypothetical protein